MYMYVYYKQELTTTLLKDSMFADNNIRSSQKI